MNQIGLLNYSNKSIFVQFNISEREDTKLQYWQAEDIDKYQN